MKKSYKRIIIFAVYILCLSFTVTFLTYSLFESVVSVSISSDIAKWNIEVNDTMITEGNSINNEFDIGDIIWQNGSHVLAGKAAPGSVGSFEIVIDPTDTQVSFYYQIEFDVESLNNDQFHIQNVREVNGHNLIRTDANTYVGIATLSQINNNDVYDILVDVVWTNDDNNNENDYEIGSNADEGVYIPVNIEINQYFGTEVFVAYS